MKITSARFVRSAFAPKDFPRDGKPEVAFLGRSNVGKSSLINSLLRVRNLARTSSTPGRTQSINFFLINEQFYFVDLPGYGYARVPEQIRQSWAPLAEKYLANRQELVLSILIVDARHEPTANDLQMKSWLEYYGLPFMIVATKADKLSNNQLRSSLLKVTSQMETDKVLAYSSTTRRGSEALWKEIDEHIARGRS